MRQETERREAEARTQAIAELEALVASYEMEMATNTDKAHLGDDTTYYKHGRDQGEYKNAALDRVVEIQILHIGQGGCVVLRDGTTCTLIDVGGAEDGRRIGAYLRSIGIDTVDVVLTTTDDGHVGGLEGLNKQCNIATIRTTDEIAAELSLSGYTAISRDFGWISGPFSLSCVATAQNGNVAVVSVTVGNRTLMYLSTLRGEDESILLNAYYDGIDISADFLVASSSAEEGTNGEALLTTIGATRHFIQMDEDKADLSTVVRLGRIATTWRTSVAHSAIIQTDGQEYVVFPMASANCNG